jgi:hypothetical protein
VIRMCSLLGIMLTASRWQYYLKRRSFASDNSGAGAYTIEVVAELLNGDGPTELILPWMGRKRLLRDVNGKWSVQTREQADMEDEYYAR